MEIAKLRKAGSREINQALSRWGVPEIPPTANTVQTPEEKSESELATLNWLHNFVRQNVKRGRVFQLKDVLLHQQADCLGYAKLMNCLGRRFALDIGIVEVVIDNGGRYTSHYVNLVKLLDECEPYILEQYGRNGVSDLPHRLLHVSGENE